jgi:hypothetical protein
MQIRNHGATPARITDVYMKTTTHPKEVTIPDVPNYCEGGKHLPHRAFLVANDHIAFLYLTSIPSVSDASQIEAGEKIMRVFGYVDYIDAFGSRHRAGYGRMYVPKVGLSDKSSGNLLLVKEKGYNYDRERTPDEGDDWHEEANTTG